MNDFNNILATGEVEELEENYTRPNNERILPTDATTLGNKKFPYALWMYFQSVSNYDFGDSERYLKKKIFNIKNISYMISSLCKDVKSNSYFGKLISKPTITKGIKYLVHNEFIRFTDDKERYCKMKNWFQYYVLMENNFIKMLLKTLTQDAIKVYLLYYSFNTQEQEGKCYLTQEEILHRVGLSYSGQNLHKLWYINNELEALGLIKKYQIIHRFSGEDIHKKNITVAVLYWKTQLYRDMWTELEVKGEITPIEIEVIKK